MGFEIIQATEKHREYVIYRIMDRWGLSYSEADDEFSRWIVNDQDSICYIGEVDGKPMATGVFDTVREKVGMNISPYNTLLWVEPEYRGNGYGKMITDIRFRWALSRGYKVIYLDTLDAESYHAKIGWELEKRINYENKNFAIMRYILDNQLSFDVTRSIYDFAPILKPLAEDFTAIFYQTILVWCKIIESDNAQNDRLWEVWIIKLGNKPIGICGLYTLLGAIDTKELWLGWLGIIPEFRNRGLGKQVMQHLYKNAKKFGCERLFSYVDKDGKPLPFYEREGFFVISTVAEYCKQQGLPNIDGDDFEDGADYVISKQII